MGGRGVCQNPGFSCHSPTFSGCCRGGSVGEKQGREGGGRGRLSLTPASRNPLSISPDSRAPLWPPPPRHTHTPRHDPRLLTANRFLSSTSCRFRRISDFRTSMSSPGLSWRSSLRLLRPGLTRPGAAVHVNTVALH